MNGEIDLELYTLSLIRLNTALQKLENGDDASEMFGESAKDLKEFYLDVVNDLNQEEVNFGEYRSFFENGKRSFPQYINVLKGYKSSENNDLQSSLDSLINTFTNLNRIAEAFKDRGDYNGK